jgi:hypothetical protein
MHVNAYLTTKRGRLERILERIIKSYPISTKHNPYYGGAFNGNDCMRILENIISLFNQLWTAVLHGEFSQEEKRRVLDIIRKHRPIWIAFYKVAPLIRSSRKLSALEQDQLIANIDLFAQEYKNRSTENITIKMHWLVCHSKDLLFRYGTLGLFSEDSLESTHTMVNSICRVFASPDGERQHLSVIRAIFVKSERLLIKLADELVDEAKKVNEEKDKKLQRRQGKQRRTLSPGTVGIDEVSELILGAMTLLRDWNINIDNVEARDDAELDSSDVLDRPPKFHKTYCEHFSTDLEHDVIVPPWLQQLHNIVCHVHTEDKLTRKKDTSL